MKRFLIVLRYELREYFSSKVFMVLTAVLALAGIILLFLPRFVDMSGFTGVNVIGKADEAQEETDPGERPLLLYVDQTGIVQPEILQQMFPDADLQEAADAQALWRRRKPRPVSWSPGRRHVNTTSIISP